jgi:hypothetical protein
MPPPDLVVAKRRYVRTRLRDYLNSEILMTVGALPNNSESEDMEALLMP